MYDDRVPYTSISIHPRQINVYYESISGRSKGGLSSGRPAQFQSNDHQNKISPTARKKISRAIDYLVFLAQDKRLPNTYHGKGLVFKIAFITLTLSSKQCHSDQTIKTRLFNQFLIEMQRKWKVQNYIWRAEKQQNGNLHFHILCDKFIPWLELRNLWNRVQQKLGYVTRYRENRCLWHRTGFHFNPQLAPQWSRKAQRKAYKQGLRTDWQSPNSTDVHSIKHVNKVNAYFKKYMFKEGQNVGVSGRLWGCSQSLSNIKGAREDVWSKIEDDLAIIARLPGVHIVAEKWYTIFYIDLDLLRQKNLNIIPDLFQVYLQNTFPEYYAN